MLRVIGGEYKRRKLEQPSLDITRPTKDIAKEGLFNSLGDITGLSFLDCFGGSGAMGIEAYSRGSRCVTIVEKMREPYKCILKNLCTLGIKDIKMLNRDFFECYKNIGGPYDIVFLDPPYKMELNCSLINDFLESNLIKSTSRVIIERENKLDDEFFNLYDVKELKYGKSLLYIIKIRS